MDIKKLSSTIRDIPDFPAKGIIFKDITPLLQDTALFNEVIEHISDKFKNFKIDKIAGIESRGFIFGMPLAVKMNVPFVPIRKKGKLPAKTVSISYELEYGSAVIEIHEDAVKNGENILIIDDLLATGGTTNAAIKIVEQLGGNVVASAFVLELAFLNGREKIENKSAEIFSILKVI
ncbi:MAG: adenine phosphoribosyltransferase [Endomicrobia bacterium]|nr:adenine phosphoribosyltransferase [Endomicrobiia bacterium]